MLQKKICMLGSFAVGKTSLVSRYVHSIFSDKYLSTIGVKVDQKDVYVGSELVRLLLWDLHGDDDFQQVQTSYLRGMSGYLLVADGTRSASLEVALRLHAKAQQAVGQVPFLLLVNKHDLVDGWAIDADKLDQLEADGWLVRRTSAKQDVRVNESFQELAERLLVNS